MDLNREAVHEKVNIHNELFFNLLPMSKQDRNMKFIHSLIMNEQFILMQR